ncbi:MAG: tetratricopeptide repeat protein [Acidobacteriota bacterium]
MTTTPATSPDRSARLGLQLLASALGIAAGLTAVAATASPGPAPLADAVTTARTQLEDGRTAAAVGQLRRHLREQPRDVDARLLLADAEHRLGLRRRALEDLQLVLAERPSSAPALTLLAHLQVEGGRRDAALGSLDQLAADGILPAELRLTRGRLLFQSGRALEAIEDVEIALSHAPENAAAWKLHGLAALAVGDDDHLVTARDSLARAAGLNPDDASTRNSLGFAHEKLGEVEEAFVEYVDAELLSGGQPSYRRNRERLELFLKRR